MCCFITSDHVLNLTHACCVAMAISICIGSRSVEYYVAVGLQITTQWQFIQPCLLNTMYSFLNKSGARLPMSQLVQTFNSILTRNCILFCLPTYQNMGSILKKCLKKNKSSATGYRCSPVSILNIFASSQQRL